MFMYVFSIVLVIASNILYHICQKSTPLRTNPFSALFLTYVTAACVTALCYWLSKTDKGLIASIKDLNWTSLILGVAIVGLELGYLLAYRAGWKISLGSLVANIGLAVALVPIGIIFFREDFDLNKVLGLFFCLIGLIFVNK